jgi:glucose-6-phosphate 1-dehydrogenase
VAPPCNTLVLFGATGDLARRKLYPALYEMALDGRLPEKVIGVARRDWDDERLVQLARESLDEFQEREIEAGAFDRLANSLRYTRGDYRQPETYHDIARDITRDDRVLFYLAVPPSLFETVIECLSETGLAAGSHVVVEKPFGRDLDSSRRLNRCLLEHFDEDAIFRIDHFLGKEEVLDLLVFRLANTFLEPAWNRHYIDRVEITMAESFGVEGRGGFYDEVGAIRDVVQNHLLQLVSLVAMEPPVSADAQALRDEKVKVLRAVRPVSQEQVVRGQYDGYRDEKGVDSDSVTETFVAMKFYIDSWRWAGVPFYIRTGKKMATTATEILIEFASPPRLFFARSDAPQPHPNHLIFRTKPGERVSISAEIKEPGEELVSRPVELVYDYDQETEGSREYAYARLLEDALEGDHRLFARADGVEEAWTVLEGLLDDPGPVYSYEPGSWGPGEADRLVEGTHGWHDPVELA